MTNKFALAEYRNGRRFDFREFDSEKDALIAYYAPAPDGADGRLELMERVASGEYIIKMWRLRKATTRRKYNRIRATHTVTGHVVEYHSMADAEAEGWVRTSISRCLNGHQDTHRGYAWTKIN